MQPPIACRWRKKCTERADHAVVEWDLAIRLPPPLLLLLLLLLAMWASD
jgi:hypothetical protein